MFILTLVINTISSTTSISHNTVISIKTSISINTMYIKFILTSVKEVHKYKLKFTKIRGNIRKNKTKKMNTRKVPR